MKSDVFKGKYLFHLHTHLTDGEPTIGEYFEYAASHGVDRLIFLEHIRRESSYDPAKFADEIRAASDASGILASVGFEAKILSSGELDISPDAVQVADVIGIAEHGFSGDFNALRQAFALVVAACKELTQTKEVVWAHPGLWLKKKKLASACLSEYLDMIRLAQDAGIRIERNLRYDLVTEDIQRRVNGSGLVLGADCHKMSDLPAWHEQSKAWAAERA